MPRTVGVPAQTTAEHGVSAPVSIQSQEVSTTPAEKINAFFVRREISYIDSIDVVSNFSKLSKKSGSLADLRLDVFSSNSLLAKFEAYVVPIEQLTDVHCPADNERFPEIIFRSKNDDELKGVFANQTIAIVKADSESRSYTYLVLDMDATGVFYSSASCTYRRPPDGTLIICYRQISQIS